MRPEEGSTQDRSSDDRTLGRSANEQTSIEGRNEAFPTSALDRLVADGLVTPALVAKRQRTAPLITADGTVSDLVTEQRR